FNPTTKISFTIPTSLPLLNKGSAGVGSVNLTVYDALGNQIKILINNKSLDGYHELNFNASNLPSGIYHYRLKAGEFSQTKKMLLIK
ncbi:MAG: T9SS type A sorting domain-containing protein, partial [Melioribacteraceae bacterium]